MTANRRARTTALASVLALSAVAAAACSDAQSDNLAVTTTQTVAVSAAETTSDPTTAQSSVASPSVPDATAAAAPAAQGNSSAPLPEANAAAGESGLLELRDHPAEISEVGQRFTVLGEPATLCVVGDGWGTHIWAVNDNASCEFAEAVFNTQTAGLNATYDNIRQNLKPSIEVTSPVTSQTYTMNCENVDVYVRCTGGNNAAVYFY